MAWLGLFCSVVASISGPSRSVWCDDDIVVVCDNTTTYLLRYSSRGDGAGRGRLRVPIYLLYFNHLESVYNTSLVVLHAVSNDAFTT